MGGLIQAPAYVPDAGAADMTDGDINSACAIRDMATPDKNWNTVALIGNVLLEAATTGGVATCQWYRAFCTDPGEDVYEFITPVGSAFNITVPDAPETRSALICATDENPGAGTYALRVSVAGAGADIQLYGDAPIALIA